MQTGQPARSTEQQSSGFSLSAIYYFFISPAISGRQFDRVRRCVWVHVFKTGIKRIFGSKQGNFSFTSIKPTIFCHNIYI